jgi:hypothetical protein
MIKAMLDRVTQSAAPDLGSPQTEAGEVPKNLIINDASETAIALAWRPVVGSRLYQIHRSESAGEGFSVLGRAEGPSFCDRGLTPRTVYRYKVAALRPDGSAGPTSNVAAGSTR